jgi:hypothetical protein
MRAFAILCCFVVGGCSPSIELPPANYVPPLPPSPKAEYDGANLAAFEAKLTGSVESSDVRESDHGPGRYVVCLRGSNSPFGPRRTYAAFFENDDYKGVRSSVMIDDCEKQSFHPFAYDPAKIDKDKDKSK